MRWSTAIDGSTAEKVFASFKNAVTKTATATAKTLQRGAPVILCTNTASNSGYFIDAPATATSIVNNLFVGLVANFPDTTTGQTGTWGGEDVGQVQVYGYNSAGLIYNASSGSVAVGNILVPDSVYGRGALVTVSAPLTFANATSTVNVSGNAVGGLAVAVAAVASITTTATAASGVFLRCM